MARRRKYPSSSGCPRIRSKGSPPASSSTSTRCPSWRANARGSAAQAESSSPARAYSCSSRARLAAVCWPRRGARTRIETRLPGCRARHKAKSGPSRNVSSTYPESSITDDRLIAGFCPISSRWSPASIRVEDHVETRSAIAPDGEGAVQLLRQVLDELQAHGCRMLDIEIDRKSDSVIPHRQSAAPFGQKLEIHPQGSHARGSRMPGRKGMLQGVGDQLVDDQADGNGPVQVQLDIVDLGRQFDMPALQSIGANQMGRQILNMGPHGNPGEIAGPVEIFMDQGHRTHPIAAFGKQLRNGGIVDPGRLKAEQAVDQLQVVLHAMVDLLEKRVLLLQRGLQP